MTFEKGTLPQINVGLRQFPLYTMAWAKKEVVSLWLAIAQVGSNPAYHSCFLERKTVKSTLLKKIKSG